MRRLSPRRFFVVKTVLFILLLLPAVAIALRLPNVVDPVEFLTGETGEFALRFLLLTLAVTPLQHISGWSWLIKLRRMIGLYAFAYVFCHFAVYVFLDLQLNLGGVWEDILDRNYITVGFAAFCLLVPLAVTSNDYLLRRMGFRRWNRLHKSVYLIAPLAVLHLLWQTRGDDLTEPLVYAAITALLLALRWQPLTEKIKRR